MRSTRQMSITVTAEMADMVKRKVASGEYASDSEVIRDGLRALQERDAAVERWLRDEVVPVAIAHEKDPSRAVPLEEAFDRVLSSLRERQRAKAAK